MKKYISLILLTIFSLGTVLAQTSFKLNPYPNSQNSQISIDELNILAVMVEFQEDNDGNTFGNGKFGSIYTQDYGNDILDPLPHNAEYFSSHLKFAQNYYTKVSDGNLNINFTVLPNVVTVSEIMREYSPEPGSDDLINIADFAKEVWELADQSFGNVQYSDYDMFVIFHAGVGREIPTPGSIGLERDLPSVYLSERGLKEIYGSEFSGFAVNNGNFLINNTAVLPSTENREIESFGETFLQEFSINGLIVGTIASYLGLPDLFNTETGTSAIGRFGLMDGQALFAYSGLFPPEPSAWEKIYLGWIEPKVVELEDQSLSLTAYEAASELENSVVKIPINSDEYYLIENRKRDANNDGITVTYKLGTSESTITFDKDYPEFSPFGADTLAGVITDIDEFDWALPGFEEDQEFEDPFGDVGLIIWHIDESVIRANIDSNTINNDRERLGVRVVEADGIFDIGEEFTNIFGETVIGEGTKQDTWYSSNPSEFYENKFDATTKPAAVTNLGANSLIKIDNISGIGNVMNFDLSVSDSDVKLLSRFQLSGTPVQILNTSQFFAVRESNGDVRMISFDGNEMGVFPHFSSVDLATYSDGGNDYVVGAFDDTLKVFVKGITLPFQTVLSAPLSAEVSAPVVVIPKNGAAFGILTGLGNGKIEEYTINTGSLAEISFTNDYSAFQNQAVKQIAASTDGKLAAISNGAYWNSDNAALTFNTEASQLAIASGPNSEYYSVVLAGNDFLFIKDGSISDVYTVNTSGDIESFSVTDLKNDENNYVIFTNGNKLEAVNFTGSQAEYFPYAFDENVTLGHSALSMELNSDDKYDLLVFDSTGNIYAVDGNDGSELQPFPISSGQASNIQPILFNSDASHLALVNADNQLYVWQLSSSAASIYWGSKYQSAGNLSYAGDASGTNAVTDFFPEERAYNWPNPVYDEETYIRFYVDENAEAEIKIFDLAGDLVDELNAQAVGGLDNEVTWNVIDIQSGVYFAHLNVVGASGKSQSKIIKIAVIK